MPTRVTCPSCKASFTAPDAMLGKSVRCGKCQKSFKLPAPDTPAEEEIDAVDRVEDESPEESPEESTEESPEESLVRPARSKDRKDEKAPTAPEPRRRRATGPSPVVVASLAIGVLAFLLIGGLVAWALLPRGEPGEREVAQNPPKSRGKKDSKKDGSGIQLPEPEKDASPKDKDGPPKVPPVIRSPPVAVADLDPEFPDPPLQNGIGLVAGPGLATTEGEEVPRGAVLALPSTKSPILNLQFLADSRTLVWRGVNRQVRYLDVPGGKRERVIKKDGVPLTLQAFAPHGRVVVAEEAGGMSFVSLKQGGFSDVFCPRGVWTAFAHDGSRVAVIPFSPPGQVLLYSVAAPSDPAVRIEVPSPIQLNFSPTGKVLAVGLRTGLRLEPSETAIIDLTTNLEVRRLSGLALAFSSTGVLATVDAGGTVNAIDLEKGTPPERLILPVPTAVRALAWSAEGQHLACAAGNDVYLFDAKGEKELGRFTGHMTPVSVLAFSPDGRWLASADQDGYLVVWPVPKIGK